MGKTLKTISLIFFSLMILGLNSSCTMGDRAGGTEVGNPGNDPAGDNLPPDSQPKPKEQQNFITTGECESKNGIVLFAPSKICPNEEKLIGEIKVGVETLVCCESSILTIQECENRGGDAIPDPGDGSLKNCDDNHYKIGKIGSDFFEGGICCVLKKP